MEVHIDQIAKKEKNTKLATKTQRLKAFGIDLGWIFALYGLFGIVLFEIFVRILPKNDLNATVFSIGIFILFHAICLFPLSWLYFAISTAWMKGDTIGKICMRIHIEREYRKPIVRMIYFLRETAKFFFMLLLPLHLMVFLTKKRQGIHDLLVRTIVVQGKSKNYDQMKKIGVLGWILGGIFVFGFVGFLLFRSTAVMNMTKDRVFSEVYAEGKTETSQYQEGSIEKLFYDSLYSSPRTEEEIYQIEKLFANQAYTVENIEFLFSEDSDKDGITDQLEVRYKSNPFVKDSDADGIDDGQEVFKAHSPVNRKVELQTKNSETWKDFDVEKLKFLLKYPKDWNYRGTSEGGYMLGITQEGSDILLEEPLVGVDIKDVPYPDLHSSMYIPDLYEAANIIEPFTVNGMKGEMLTFVFDIKAAIIRNGNTMIVVTKILPEDIEDGIFDYMIASVQKGEDL